MTTSNVGYRSTGMSALTENNIESELSYAYLHAIASKAGMECTFTGRHSDGAGVDARVHALGRFGGPITDITIEIQLKATRQTLTEADGKLAFPLKLKNYNDLRDTTQAQRILAVLLLPADPQAWLSQTPAELALKQCAYWTSLRGAPPSPNETNQTVYLPKARVLSVAALLDIAALNSNQGWLLHA